MFALTTSHRYRLYAEPTDMRKSFDGLCGLVQAHMDQGALSGCVFVFINKRRDKIKLLHWMGSGFILYYKRLEEGTFEVPVYGLENASLSLTYIQLVMLIDGISITNLVKRSRYSSTKTG